MSCTGDCDKFTGVCACFDGYDAGVAECILFQGIYEVSRILGLLKVVYVSGTEYLGVSVFFVDVLVGDVDVSCRTLTSI